jgi:hypothetical protein
MRPSAGQVYAYMEDVDVAKRTAIDFVNYAVKPLLKAPEGWRRLRAGGMTVRTES